AAVLLRRAWRLVTQCGLRNEYVAPIPVWLTTALRNKMIEGSPYRPLPGELRSALRMARMALRRARRYRNNLPHALRELGLITAMQGKPRKARRHLDESLKAAEQQGARFEHAQSLLAWAQVGLAMDWPGAAEEMARARQALRALGAYWVLGEADPEVDQPPSPGLLDRFDTVLEAGRAIATALSRDAVGVAVESAALTVLRAEECLVLEIVPGGSSADPAPRRLQVARGGREPGSTGADVFSCAVVERAIEAGRPIVVAEGAGGSPTESLVLSGARSVLCAPITARGAVVWCFYVSHRQVGGLFGKDEERLAEFIATLAGAALENVEGMGRIEDQLIAGSAAGLAHAIKSPVAVVRAYLNLLPGVVEAGDRAAFAQYLQTMEGAIDRIGELIRRLHRVRIEGSRLQSVTLKQVIDQAVDEVRGLFPETRGYRIAIETAPGSPDVIRADGEQLVLVLANLLTNAGQAMPGGGLTRIGVRPDGDGRVAFTVSDQGDGIPAALQSRLFEPFVTTRSEGTGLGLWVCRKIVEQHHHGRITVSSVAEQGTAVTISLPIVDSSPAF
ncbi:MAG: GAF domain-containing sensor histidine kinase, partial [Nitrospiria bacterium]